LIFLNQFGREEFKLLASNLHHLDHSKEKVKQSKPGLALKRQKLESVNLYIGKDI